MFPISLIWNNDEAELTTIGQVIDEPLSLSVTDGVRFAMKSITIQMDSKKHVKDRDTMQEDWLPYSMFIDRQHMLHDQQDGIIIQSN